MSKQLRCLRWPRMDRHRKDISLAATLLVILLSGPWAAPLRAQTPATALRVTAKAERLLFQGDVGNGLARFMELEPQAEAKPKLLFEQAVTNAFDLSVSRFDGARDRLFSSFTVQRVGADGTTSNRFVEEFEDISRWRQPFPVAASKKGLQVQMVEDALALGVKHAALNVDLTGLVDLSGGTNGPVWEVDGQFIRFRLGPVRALDRQIQALTTSNVVVSLILLTYASGEAARDALMLHPRYDTRAPNHLAAFNTVSAKGVLHFRACLEFLADRYCRPEYHGCVANYILGNEVNSHWFWANMGRATMEEFAEDYLRTARIAATALRRISSSARLYLSLEHHWNIRYPGGDAQQTFAGRPFLDYFAWRAREQGDFEWHLAFHPYPENLFEPRTWKDKSATLKEETPRITFKNLEMLPRYLQRSALLFRGQPRHILLSEQGFHTVHRPDAKGKAEGEGGGEGEVWQAAAYAYAYYKCAHLAGIDAFILHRHVDHRDEGGLNLGLWSRNLAAGSAAEPARRKRIYDVFKAADTPDWRQHFEFALPVIGIKTWEELAPQNAASGQGETPKTVTAPDSAPIPP